MSATRTKSWSVLLLFFFVCFGLIGCADDESQALRMGGQAPSFTAEDLQGQLVSLDSHAGKPVILRFFVPDCKYCRADTVIFNDYYRKYKEKGLGVVYINTEPKPGEVQKFASDLGITFPVVLDPDRKIANQYRVQVVPQTIILDPGHKLIGAILGGVSKEQLDNLLLPFLE
ncbi:MAG: TlpA disulfide reductase family protein [Desulfobulbaceae bacterium]|nr:TlpA disulfide reductase family protein [Desulfobulbaceae bacterium]